MTARTSSRARTGILVLVRICSLVPAATEILFGLGLGDSVVVVTLVCDWPPEAAAKPVVTASLIQTGDLSSGEIDRMVALDRERRLLEALDDGLRDEDELLDRVWSDAPPALRPAAALTLRAHLCKLEDEGRLG